MREDSIVRYENFDLQIERATRSRFRARVLHSPVGSGVECTFSLPFADATLRQMRSIQLLELDAIREFGQSLYTCVFADRVGVLLSSSLQRLQRINHASQQQTVPGLRIRLRFADLPELASLPWEYLYVAEQGRFLGLFERVTIVRYLDVEQPVEPLRVQTALRMLVMIATPNDLPVLNPEQEWQRLESGLQSITESSLIQIERIQQGTFDELRRCLENDHYHILHFIGHGSVDAQTGSGVLILENAAGRSEPISTLQLTQLLANHDSLKMVVLNTCEGARASADDTFTGLAQSLVRGGIPAVIGMQFLFSDQAAVRFTSAFYSYLARGMPVDAALMRARMAIFTLPNQVEWATPVLFLRSEDGIIFAMEETTPPPPSAHGDESMAERSSTTTLPATVETPNPAKPKTRWQRVAAWFGRLDPTQTVAVIITAIIGPIIVYLVTTSGGDQTEPTPAPTPSGVSTIAAAALVTTTAVFTPTSPSIAADTPSGALPTSIAIPTVERKPLAVGIADFVNCPEADFAGQLRERILAELRVQQFDATRIRFTALPALMHAAEAQAISNQEVVLWGECVTDHVQYHGELLLVRPGLDHRIAQPEALSLTAPSGAEESASAALAGALAYFSSTGADTTEVAAVLLNQSSTAWAQGADLAQTLPFHLLLGNAWLSHADRMDEDALSEYNFILSQLTAAGDDAAPMAVATLNNLGWLYYQQRNYTRAIQAFDRAIELKSDHVWAYLGRSAAKVRTRGGEQFSSALEDCLAIARLRANFSPSYLCRAWAAFISNLHDGPFEDRELGVIAQNAIKLDLQGRYPAGYFYAGVASCKIEHNLDRAIEHFIQHLTKSTPIPIWDADHFATIKEATVWLSEDLAEPTSCQNG
jgi:tetratricopeptide (TPR) repeat protein